MGNAGGSAGHAEERALLRRLFEAAVRAAQPATCVPPKLPKPPRGRTVVVGAGKAAAAMAAAVDAHWPGPLTGLVVTRYAHAVPCQRIRVIEAAHPVPDAAGLVAAERILGLVRGLTPDDLVLCLISGGGSALLVAPAEGVTFADKQAVTRELLRCGATIHEINCVRKHLSRIKGGRLATAAHPARLVTLAISDVPGDDPATIASGPTVADPTTYAQARAILERYRITPPASVAACLMAATDESPKPDDERLVRSDFELVATPRLALAAAEQAAQAAGFGTLFLGDALEGEARELGARHAELARSLAAAARPTVVLSGGETTVTVTGSGRGGRNAEYALGLALALDGAAGVSALAADTDGIDGSEDNAGALVLPDSLDRARGLGLDAAALLANNDAYGFFAALGDLVVTGPTRTNVNDFRAILVTPA